MKKLIGILFIFSACTGTGFSQDELLRRPIDQSFMGMYLRDALDAITRYQNIYFAYASNLKALNEPVNFTSNHLSFRNVLDSLLNGTGLSYMVFSNQVIIRENKPTIKKILLRGTICSENNRQPVEYASIAIKGKTMGTNANGKGYFELQVTEANLPDSLVIMSLGFEPYTVPVHGFASLYSATFYLKQRYIPVENVEVTGFMPRIEKLGNHGTLPGGSIYIDTHGQQTAVYIPNPKKINGKIKFLRFYLSKKGNTDSPFRVHIYAPDSANGGGPGMELLPVFLVVHPGNGSGWCTVDISDYNIRMPGQGFFAAMEGIYPGEYELQDADAARDEFTGNNGDEGDDFEPATISYGQKLGFNRKHNNTWHYSLSHTWFQLDKKAFNAMISAGVIVYRKQTKDAN